VGIGQLSEAVPVQCAGAGFEEVCDVGAIESFSTRDEELGGDHLFRGKNFAAYAENFIFPGAIDPRLFYGEGCVTNAGDEVDEVFAAPRLGEPDGVLNVSLEALFDENLKGAGDSVWGCHEVEILGRAPDSGVVVKSEAPAYGERDARLQQSFHDALVARKGIGCPVGFFG
jgi:hypothetical protein